MEKYLPQCLDSLISQSFRGIEIIIVDDGSTDSTPSICDSYALKDSRIKVLHKQNGGLVSARQEGVKLAAGDYIVCVDGDDWVETEYIENFAREIKRTNADIVCCGAKYAYEDHCEDVRVPFPSGSYDRARLEKEIFPFLIVGRDGVSFPPTVWGKAFRRELYTASQLRLNPGIYIGEDDACTKPCIFNAEAMSILSSCSYFYRQNPSSLTKKPKPRKWSDARLIAEHFSSALDVNAFDIQNQIYRSITDRLFYISKSRFYCDDSYRDIRAEIRRNLNEPYFKECIARSDFKFGTMEWLEQFILRYRLYFLLYILAMKRYKRRKLF